MNPTQPSPDRLARLRQRARERRVPSPALRPPEALTSEEEAFHLPRLLAREALSGAFAASPPGILTAGLGLAGAGLQRIEPPPGGPSATLSERIAQESMAPSPLPTTPEDAGTFRRLYEGAQRFLAGLTPEGVSPTLMDIDIESLGAVPPGVPLQEMAQAPASLLEHIGGRPTGPGEQILGSIARGIGMGGALGAPEALGGVLEPGAAIAAGAASQMLGDLAEEAGAPWWVRMGAEALPFGFAPHKTPVGPLHEELQSLQRRGVERIGAAQEVATGTAERMATEAEAAQRALDVARGEAFTQAPVAHAPSASLAQLETRARALEQAGLSKEAKALSSATKALEESGAQLSRRLRNELMEKYRLLPEGGRPAVDPLPMARSLRERVKAARKAAYEPLSQRYDAWDTAHGNVGIVVEASEGAALSRQAREMARTMRSSAERVTDDVMRGMLSEDADIASRLSQMMDSIAEGEGALPIQANVLRDARTSLARMSEKAIPGDAKNQFKFLQQKLDRLLQQHPNEGAYDSLKQLNADYKKFKQRFEGNRLMRPILTDYVPVEHALEGIRTAEVSELLGQALGREGTQDLARFHLQDVLSKEPAQALKDLQKNRVLQRTLPSGEYREIVQALQAETSQATLQGVVEALNTVERGLEMPEISAAGREALEASRADLQRQLEGFKRPEVQKAQRAIERARVERDQAVLDLAKVRMTESSYQKLSKALQDDIPLEKLTPGRVQELLQEAQQVSPVARENLSQALVGHILDTGQPLEFSERLVAFKPQLDLLVGPENGALLTQAWPGLSEAVNRLSRDQINQILESVAERAATRPARQWAQLMFRGTRSYLYASLLQGLVGSMASMASKGRSLRRILGALNPERPAMMRQTMAAILSAEGSEPFLKAVEEEDSQPLPATPLSGRTLSTDRLERLRERARRAR